MKQRLFRYMPAEYAPAFVKRGELLFRSLSYFRDYEDAGVRGDPDEGTRVHRPEGGLKIRKVDTGEELTLPHRFESTANEDDIFACCFSTVLDPQLAERFSANMCVEIKDSSALIARIRNALALRSSIKDKLLAFGAVKYYEHKEPPIVDWALPERIALSKPASFSWQQEYRIAFSVNGAFDVENVKLRLVTEPRSHLPRATAYPQRVLKLGNISKLCTVHDFINGAQQGVPADRPRLASLGSSGG